MSAGARNVAEEPTSTKKGWKDGGDDVYLSMPSRPSTVADAPTLTLLTHLTVGLCVALVLN